MIIDHPRIRGLSEWTPLARGGVGVVWQANQLPLDRLVAVKVYERYLDEGDRRRFLSEAVAAARLSGHPGIVTTYDGGVLPDGQPYLIMQLCPGGSLTRWLKPENRPTEEQVLQVAVRMADALVAAHACQVLHRDVKPANILIDSDGNPRLADFGLAALADFKATMADPLHLTPAYAPPEALELQPATEAGDVYSLAATLYALLVGSPPRDVGPGSVALPQLVEAAKRPISRLPGVNWHLMEVLMAALSDDPAARPSAAEFRDQLANVPTTRISKRQPLARASERTFAGQPERVETPPSRNKPRVGVAAVVAALLTVIVSVTAWQIREPASPSVPAVTTQSTTSGPGADGYGAASGSVATIELEVPAAGKPFQAVPIHGTYLGGAERFLRVERLEAGRWVAFPLPTKTDRSGQFTAHVELGQPGQYQLRVLDPDSGVTSEATALVIKG